MPYFEDFKYDRPYLYRALIVTLATAAVTVSLCSIPETEVTRDIGLIDLKNRAAALRKATYWQFRALLSTNQQRPNLVEYGFALGLDADGRAIISLPNGGEFALRRYKIANADIVDRKGADAFISQYRQSNARIDVFGSAAVIWIDGEPVNLSLISHGFAAPDGEVQTSIVENAFAAYFWNEAIGKKNEK